MPASPTPLYTAAQTRALDRSAIEAHGIPGIVLMKRAGASTLAEIRRRWPGARSLTVLCGGASASAISESLRLISAWRTPPRW